MHVTTPVELSKARTKVTENSLTDQLLRQDSFQQEAFQSLLSGFDLEARSIGPGSRSPITARRKDGRIYLSGAERVGLEPYGAVTQTDSGPKKVTSIRPPSHLSVGTIVAP